VIANQVMQNAVEAANTVGKATGLDSAT